MAPHLERAPLVPQLRRLLQDGLETCIGHVEDTAAREPSSRMRDADEPIESTDDATRVHDARRKLKWLRALLRLVRPSLREDVFRKEDRCFRDAGRHLAEARAEVARARCLRELLDHYALGPELATHAVSLFSHDARLTGAARAAALEPLKAARARELAFLPEELSFDTLLEGVIDELKRTRRAYRRALRQPTSHHLHEWRKHVKYHQHQMDLLKELVPELSERATSLKSLAELLGSTHDLADLSTAVESGSHRESRRKGQADLAQLLASREAELALRALTLGRPLFEARARTLRELLQRRFP